MKKNKFKSLFLAILLVGIATGFSSINNDTKNSNATKKVNIGKVMNSGNAFMNNGVPVQTDASSYYTDNFDNGNSLANLRSRGYVIKRNGSDPLEPTPGPTIGASASTWFTGVPSPTVFNSFNGPDSGYVSSNFASTYPDGILDNWLILPSLNVASGDSLTFYARGFYGVDSISVMYSASGDTTVPLPDETSPEWVELGRFKAVPSGQPGYWEYKAFAAPSSGTTARFAIRNFIHNAGLLAQNSDWIGIDGLEIKGADIPPPAFLKMNTPVGKHGMDCLLNGGCCFNDLSVGSAPQNGDFTEFNTSILRNNSGIPTSLRMQFLNDPQPINGQIPIDENVVLSARASNDLGYQMIILRKGNYTVDYTNNAFGEINVGARFINHNELAMSSPFGKSKFVRTAVECRDDKGVCWKDLNPFSYVTPYLNDLVNRNNNGVFKAWITSNDNSSTGTVQIAFLDDPQPTNGVLSVDTLQLDEEASNAMGYSSVILLGGDYTLDYSNYEFGEITLSAELIDPVTPLEISVIPEGLLLNSSKLSISDTSVVYLRSNVSPYFIIDTAYVVIDSLTFSGTCYFKNISPGNYYIIVKHRNSMETWSSNPVSISDINNSYDFTTSSSQAFGNNMLQKSGKWCIYSGDVNQDGIIDAGDLSLVENDAANSLDGYVQTDVTGDNFVDAADLAIVESNANISVTVFTP